MLFGNPEGGTSRAATNVDKIKWPNGVIPYEFDCSVGEYLRGFSSFSKYKYATYTPSVVAPCQRMDPDSGIWTLESGIQLKESAIPLTIGNQNPSSIDKGSGIHVLES